MSVDLDAIENRLLAMQEETTQAQAARALRDFLNNAPTDIESLVAEVRRLTDANTHLERLAAAWKLTAEQTEDEARAQVERLRDLLSTDGTLEDAVTHLGSILMDAGIGLPVCDRAPTCQSLHLGHRIHALADERDRWAQVHAAAREILANPRVGRSTGMPRWP